MIKPESERSQSHGMVNQVAVGSFTHARKFLLILYCQIHKLGKNTKNKTAGMVQLSLKCYRKRLQSCIHELFKTMQFFVFHFSPTDDFIDAESLHCGLCSPEIFFRKYFSSLLYFRVVIFLGA